MIHFKQELKDEALALIKLKDNIDLLNDISDISNHLHALQNYTNDDGVLISASNLDEKMLKKYPIINEILKVGNLLANTLQLSHQPPLSQSESLQSNLKQDMYGILCQTLIKHQIIKSCEQFIDTVD